MGFAGNIQETILEIKRSVNLSVPTLFKNFTPTENCSHKLEIPDKTFDRIK